MGEGACFVLLETEAHAGKRGAKVYAEFCGHGMSNDAFHRTRPDPSGAGQARAIAAALQDASVSPRDIDVVYAHGTGTPANDEVELTAIGTIIGTGAADVPVVSVKGAIGHTIAASGPINVAFGILTLQRGLVAGNIGLREPIEGYEEWNLPKQSFAAQPRCVLVNAFAFGGNNSSAVIRSYEPG